MCRWIAYRGRPIFLETLLFEPENSLIEQSLHARKAVAVTNGDGFGVGWYGDRPEPGTYHEILPAWNDRNLKSLAHQLRSGLFFGHVRASTGTATSRANCHPFAYGRWLFMHNGQIGGYDRVRRRLDQLIPDHLYPHRQGTTDSELFFYLLFHFGLEEDPTGAIRRTAAAVGSIMREAGIAEPLRLTAVLADGQRVFAVRHATDDKPPTLYWCDGDDDQRERQLIVVSEPLDRDPGRWNVVPPEHLLIAGADNRVQVLPFSPDGDLRAA
jgi:glutamine amidotransferase